MIVRADADVARAAEIAPRGPASRTRVSCAFPWSASTSTRTCTTPSSPPSSPGWATWPSARGDRLGCRHGLAHLGPAARPRACARPGRGCAGGHGAGRRSGASRRRSVLHGAHRAGRRHVGHGPVRRRDVRPCGGGLPGAVGRGGRAALERHVVRAERRGLTRDAARARTIAPRLQAGTVNVNGPTARRGGRRGRRWAAWATRGSVVGTGTRAC